MIERFEFLSYDYFIDNVTGDVIFADDTFYEEYGEVSEEENKEDSR